ncbi:hypothetical protein MMC28_001850 [Mycoblastus sanguinarius]|nr:hypothetical protein [Mycoblastus sanguinarius]
MGANLQERPKPPKPTLQSLPGEIRNTIWRMLLTTPYTFNEYGYSGHTGSYYDFQPAILTVNHQIYAETHDILNQENMWIVVIINEGNGNWPHSYADEGAYLPVVSRHHGKNPVNITSPALTIQLNSPICVEEQTSTLITTSESLPDLVQLLHITCCMHPHIPAARRPHCSLYVGSSSVFTRTEMELNILEPLSKARGFGDVIIDGNIEDRFGENLKKEMMSSWKSLREVFEHAFLYLEDGDKANNAGLTKAASQYYKRGHQFVFFASQVAFLLPSINTHHHLLESKKCARLQNTFNTRWAKTLLKLQYYADAKELADSLVEDYRTHVLHTAPVEMLQMVLVSALASIGLEKEDEFPAHIDRLMTAASSNRSKPWGDFYVAATVMWMHPSDTENNKLRGVDVHLASIIFKELDELLEYCKGSQGGDMRCVDVQNSLPNRKEMHFPMAQDWSRKATVLGSRRKLEARTEKYWIVGLR